MPNTASGTITATGTTHAIPVDINTLLGDDYCIIDIGPGTFTGTVLVEVLSTSLGTWQGFSCIDQSSANVTYSAGQSIVLTANTPKTLRLNGVGGRAQVRIYATAVTGTIPVGLTTWAGTQLGNLNLVITSFAGGVPFIVSGTNVNGLAVGPTGTTSPNLNVDTTTGRTQLTLLNLGPKPTDTYSNAMTIDVTKSHHVIAASFTTSATTTLTPSGAGTDGDTLEILTETDGSGTVTATFGGTFHSSGTQATTSSKFSSIMFKSDGTRWIEMCRTTALS